MPDSLTGKVALVTGASRGIGKDIALEFAREGAFVFLNCNKNTSKAEEVLAEIKKNGGDGAVTPFNVSDEDAVDAAIKEMVKDKGKLDILVNNAGITQNNLLMRTKTQEWDDVMNINLKGTFLLTRAVCRPMMKAKGGSIINMSSVVGQMGNVGQAAYCAAKAGIIGFTKAAAKELASRNIRVNAVAPGYIATDMTDDMDEQVKEHMLAMVPMGTIGEPRNIATSCVFLASDASNYMTGQVIGVNGGMYM